MKALRYILAGAVALIGLLLVIGLFLPASRHVERSVIMQGSSQELIPYIDGFRRFNEWSPWHELDPDTRYEFSGPEHGVGARLAWHSDKPDIGSGAQEIIELAPGRVSARLSFDDQGDSGARTSILYADRSDGLQVTWAFDMDFGYNLLYRWFGLMMDGPIGAEYDQGLGKLKLLVERDAALAAQAAGNPVPTGQLTPVPSSPQ